MSTHMWFSPPNGGGRGGGVLTLTDEEALVRLERGEKLEPVRDRAALVAELLAAAEGQNQELTGTAVPEYR